MDKFQNGGNRVFKKISIFLLNSPPLFCFLQTNIMDLSNNTLNSKFNAEYFQLSILSI